MFCLSNVIAAVDYAVERRLVLSFHPGRFNLLAGNFDLSEPRERLTHQIYENCRFWRHLSAAECVDQLAPALSIRHFSRQKRGT
jgi:hypothetical protein